jgi:hypothetical protein
VATYPAGDDREGVNMNLELKNPEKLAVMSCNVSCSMSPWPPVVVVLLVLLPASSSAYVVVVASLVSQATIKDLNAVIITVPELTTGPNNSAGDISERSVIPTFPATDTHRTTLSAHANRTVS